LLLAIRRCGRFPAFRLFIILLSLFFSGQSIECAWCERLNCIELNEGFCENTGQAKITGI